MSEQKESPLQRARRRLREAAQAYEDEAHANETMMDACGDPAGVELAEAARLHAAELNRMVQEALPQ